MWLALLFQVAMGAECPDPGVLARRAERDAAALYLVDALQEVDQAVGALGCGPLAETELLAQLWRTRGWIAALQDNEELAGIYFAASRRMAPESWTLEFGDKAREMWLAAPGATGTARLRITGAGGNERVGFDGAILEDLALEVAAGPHVVQIGELPQASRYARMVRLPDGATADVVADAPPPEPEPEPEAPTLAFALPAPLARDGSPLTFGVQLGAVLNDPFLKRSVGQLTLGYQPSPHFGIELGGSFAPDLGETDWRSITRQMVQEAQIAPDVSRISWVGSAGVVVVPVWGRARILGKPRPVALAARLGVAAVGTSDDLEMLQSIGDPVAESTAQQVHPGLDAGLALRVHMADHGAFELRSRRLQYIEVVSGSTLQMKRNQILQLGYTWWLGAVR